MKTIWVLMGILSGVLSAEAAPQDERLFILRELQRAPQRAATHPLHGTVAHQHTVIFSAHLAGLGAKIEDRDAFAAAIPTSVTAPWTERYEVFLAEA